MNDVQRNMRARMGAHALHAQYDSRDVTAAARDKFMSRFEEQVDPLRTLPEQERLRRAKHARRSYFTGLALKSAQARARRASAEKPA